MEPIHQLIGATKDSAQAKCGAVFILEKGQGLKGLPISGWSNEYDCGQCESAATWPPDPTTEAKKRGLETTQAKTRKVERADRAARRDEEADKAAAEAAVDAIQAAERDSDPPTDDSAINQLFTDDIPESVPAQSNTSAPASEGLGHEREADPTERSVRPDGQPWDRNDRCDDGGIAPCPEEPYEGASKWGADGWDNTDRYAWWWRIPASNSDRILGEARLSAWWACRANGRHPEPRLDVQDGSSGTETQPTPPDQPRLDVHDQTALHTSEKPRPPAVQPDPVRDVVCNGQAVTPRREHELTEPIVFPHVPVVITEHGTVMVVDSQRCIPDWFAFDGDRWCVDATIEIRPNRRKP